jgi:hypothetical protein
MKVRCLRILEGGRNTGVELEAHTSIHIGGEYVVLGLSANSDEGVSYMLLRDASALRTAVWPSAMFEITSTRLSSSWSIIDPYGTGLALTLQPKHWSDSELWDRAHAGDPTAQDLIRRDITLMHEEEGERPPQAPAM